VDDDPLVVPAHEPLDLLHQVVSRVEIARRGHVLHEAVVELDKEEVELRNERVLVVARVADQGDAFGVAR
jgi:hypothetical protein